MINFTPTQKKVIEEPKNSNMLVSASAGTGKTTVLVERIFELIKSRSVSVSQIAVVTFTNLAAAEMKNKLVKKLSEEKESSYLAEELQKVDTAAISTLDSFCVNLVREYFYVVGVDPAFSILDDMTKSALENSCLSEVLKEFHLSSDKVFQDVYSIFSKKRNEESLKKQLLNLYKFACTQSDFELWYNNSRNNFLDLDSPDNKISNAVICELNKRLAAYKQIWVELGKECQSANLSDFVDVCNENTFQTNRVLPNKLSQAFSLLKQTEISSPPTKDKKKDAKRQIDPEILEELRGKLKAAKGKFKAVGDDLKEFLQKDFSELQSNLLTTLELNDKIVEILRIFEQRFKEVKMQRGVLDFVDIERFAYQILQNDEVKSEIRQRFKLVFVDEYQDTNDIQEAILKSLASSDNLFLVGDVKQSIYGFRGCDSQIFVNKREEFLKNPTGNSTFELNDNFRSDGEILNFVNVVFNRTMSEDFGSVNYKRDAQLCGKNNSVKDFPSVEIAIVAKSKKPKQELPKIYDITAPPVSKEDNATKEGKIVAAKIKQLVGKTIVLPNGEEKTISYNDIAILSRSLTEKAQTVFNVLVEQNIPVAANFKADGFNSKEIRDIINFLKVLNNPLEDIPLLGVCLSHFGKLSDDEIATVKMATDNLPQSFFSRLLQFAGENKNELGQKVSTLLDLIERLRFLSLSLCVDDLILSLLKLTNFHLFVQGLPNGQTRIRKLWAFVDSLKAKSFAQSVDKFVSFVDEPSDKKAEEGLSTSNAVRLMTMHASKGLEFPVVFLIDAGCKFKDMKKGLTSHKDIGIALYNYNMETRQMSESLVSFVVKEKNKLKQSEEEARLLYVALTRAKNHLVVVTSDASYKMLPPSEANSCSEWILSALFECYGDNAEKLKQDGIVLKVWSQDDLQNSASIDMATETEAEPANFDKILQKIQTEYRFKQSALLPSKVVSSALDNAYLDFSEALPKTTLLVDDTNGRDLGTAYHKVLENSPLDADLECLRAIVLRLVEGGLVSSEIADQLDLHLILKALQNEDFQKLFVDGEAFHELPFVLLVAYNQLFDSTHSEKIMLQGVLDLLILKKDSAVVVDYKFVSDSRFVERNYAKQLQSYKKAVTDITGITNVEAYVLSIKDSKLIKM